MLNESPGVLLNLSFSTGGLQCTEYSPCQYWTRVPGPGHRKPTWNDGENRRKSHGGNNRGHYKTGPKIQQIDTDERRRVDGCDPVCTPPPPPLSYLHSLSLLPLGIRRRLFPAEGPHPLPIYYKRETLWQIEIPPDSDVGTWGLWVWDYFTYIWSGQDRRNKF